MKLANIDLKGLNTYASHRSVQENYLLDCNNVVCDKAGVISTRRGFSFFNDALVSCKKIFSAIQNIFVNADSKLYYDGGAGTFTQVTFPNTSTIDANDSNQKIQIEDQNKSLYFNGKRVSSETGNPVDKKIKKLSRVSSNVVNAGLEAPINLSLTLLTGQLGQIPANNSFAIRVFYQYTDANDFLITSQVSDRIVGTNTSGSAAAFELKFQIPVQYLDRVVGIYYAISNFTTSPVIPDDNLFWSSTTLMFDSVNINNGLDSVFTFSDFVSRDNILNAVDLYTNASQEGILYNNTPPICAVDIETYQNFTFYANVLDRLQKRVIAKEPLIGVTALTIGGITYQRAATSDYSATPVLFSGSNSYYTCLDLCRAVTATQKQYRLIFEDDNEIEVEVWQSRNKIPGNGVRGLGASNGTYIYNVDSVTGVLYQYTPSTNTWKQLSAADPTILEPTCQYYNGYLYVVGGYKSGLTSIPTQRYNIATDTWDQTLAPMTTPIDGIYQSGSFIYNDKIYVVGGFGTAGFQNIVKIYDITNNSWSTGANLPTATTYIACAALGDFAYCVGGQVSGPALTNVLHIYDIINDSWSTGANYPFSIYGVAITAYNGFIYTAGGVTFTSSANVSFVKYDPTANTWTAGDNTLEKIAYCLASVVDGALYITGGYGDATQTTMSERYKIDGFLLQFQERFIGDGTDISYTSNYITDYDFEFTDTALYRFEQKNTVQFSKQGQPEAVPFFNNFQCGSASYDILRLSALRSSLMILKTDGIYQLNGVSPETFSVQQLDPTFVLIAPQSLAKLNNEIYCLTNKGVVAINESGAKIISYPIKDLIDYDVAQVANLKTDINGTAYEDDYRYVLTINNKTYTYNYVSDQWTIWFSGKSDIASWTVFNSNLYYLDSTRAYRERKTLTSADFQDENNAGIDASIKFNNLELNPGNMMDVIAMQILQRTQSNLTASITPDNNFNSGTLFTQLLDKYVVRVMFPNECRKAFYFRPLIEWNTEIAASPGTFSDLQLEGLDFDYDETASNIK